MATLAWTRRMVPAIVGASLLIAPLASAVAAEPAPPRGDAQARLTTVVIPVEGMVCFACAATVKRAVRSLDGVVDVEVSIEKRTAKVTFAAGRLSAERIAAAISAAGYKAGTPRAAE
jgi:copper chaperone CopZ